jgi:hypothetical protein
VGLETPKSALSLIQDRRSNIHLSEKLLSAPVAGTYECKPLLVP